MSETGRNSTVLVVNDAAELDESSPLSHRLPGRNAAHRYWLRDPELRRSRMRTFIARYAIHRAGDLQLVQVEERFGTALRITEPGMGAHCFTLVRAGTMSLFLPETGRLPSAARGAGLIHFGQPGMEAETGNGSVRSNLWIPRHRFEAALRACLQDQPEQPLSFDPLLDWGSRAGASLRRLLEHVEAEFAEPGGLTANPAGLAAMADLFVHTALRGLRHNYSARLERADDTPVPRHLRRAEAYLHACAGDIVRLEDVAAAAGCGPRAVQRAFRHFRGTTMHGALRTIRLKRARADLALGEGSVFEIARRWGFSNLGRFTIAYQAQFGEHPRSVCGRP